MKKVLFMMFSALAMMASAQTTFQVDGVTYTVTGPNTVNLTDGTVEGDFVIPSQVENDGVSYTVKNVGERALSWCGRLTSVTIPSTIDSIGYGAFMYDSNLKTIRLGEGLKYIGGYAFSGAVPDSVDIPSSVEVIDEHAFFGSSTKTVLSKITLHDGLRYIGDGAFYSNAFTEIDIPATVDSIGKTVFLNCKNLQKVTLHDGLRKIGDGAFNQCVALTDIVLPSTLESVGMEVFMNAKALATINIPAGLKEIGESFVAGTSVSTINMDAGNPYFAEDGGVVYTKDYSILKLAPVKGLTSYTVNGKTIGIDGGAFMGSDIKSVTLPDGLVAINDYAFCQSQLSKINFPATLVFLGEQAFASTQFTEITLPENVPFVNDGELAGCKLLTKITIPSGVRSVYAHAFNNCTSLDSIVAHGVIPPTIEEYYDEYDSPIFHVPSSTVMLIPKGSTFLYRDAGWSDLTLTEDSIYPLSVVSTTPVDSASVDGYAGMSFEVEFNDDITLLNASPRVFIRKDSNYSAATIEPSGDGWHASARGKKLTVWGADEDGFTDVFNVEEGRSYYVIIPEDIVKGTRGALNNQVVIFVRGQKATAVGGVRTGGTPDKVVARYNAGGQRVPATARGLQIVKYADGTARKVVVR